ncbi:phage holin family protein [Microbaculum marinum]|uniref:Phage holin family protein n=1 Tax=Microbaculum marinum TaxID=1764581 RepID=A0AAW9RUL3_9HYPH
MSINSMVRAVAETAVDAVRPAIEETVRDAARNAARRTIFFVAALILLAIVLVFAEFALFLWLRTHMAPYFAALIVAGVALALMAIALLVALASGGRPKPEMPVEPDHSALEAQAEASARFRMNGEPWTTLARDAESLGKSFGKEASGSQLVLGAFVVGMLLGHLRK